ncbi:hypothetical protein Droror1_Dr00024548, partial [Drosera rotundifolia]
MSKEGKLLTGKEVPFISSDVIKWTKVSVKLRCVAGYGSLMQGKYLVVWKAELYVGEKTSDPDLGYGYDYSMDEYEIEVDSFDRPLK